MFWTCPDAGSDPQLNKGFLDYLASGKPNDEEPGFKVLARMFMPQNGTGAYIAEAESLAYIYKHTGPWTRKFKVSIEVTPGLSDEEWMTAKQALPEEFNSRLICQLDR